MITRLPLKIKNNPEKVILQFFDPWNENRIKRIISVIDKFSEEKVIALLENVLLDFEKRHKHLKSLLKEHFLTIEKYLPDESSYSEERKLLLGAYFSKEYSIEASASFNPSIVSHPDQSNLKPGELRFIISMRATGEGHISSTVFRSGVLSVDNEIKLDFVSRYCILPKEYILSNDNNDVCPNESKELTKEEKYRLSNANYDIKFEEDSDITERVLFPYSNAESIGMEDARFVRFVDDDGTVAFHATYTAYNGRSYKTQLISTKDFIEFKIRALYGTGVKDKGMALFPRKINGKYAMISREDSESIFVLFSDTLYCWNEPIKIKNPEYDWELMQLGNCGSPIELESGWLLITHAVGPMRKYVISACLLDKENPARVIGMLNAPLISPNEEEREGYVPNVVYSCGALVHNDELIIPYAMSDSYSGFAKIAIDNLLAEMV